MDKNEKNTNNQKANEKPGRGKKKGLTPHHLKKQIFLSNLYYTVHPEELEQILQDLNAELSKAGITLTADEYTYLNIDIDQDKLTVLTTRKAGRKKKRSGVLYEQVMEYAKTHTSMEVAEWLGLTRQTYYRKLKAHRESNHDGTIEF